MWSKSGKNRCVGAGIPQRVPHAHPRRRLALFRVSRRPRPQPGWRGARMDRRQCRYHGSQARRAGAHSPRPPPGYGVFRGPCRRICLGPGQRRVEPTPELQEIFGFEPAETTRGAHLQKWLANVHPDDRAMVLERMRESESSALDGLRISLSPSAARFALALHQGAVARRRQGRSFGGSGRRGEKGLWCGAGYYGAKKGRGRRSPSASSVF